MTNASDNHVIFNPEGGDGFAPLPLFLCQAITEVGNNK
jgi:hypothetical protein